MKKWMLTVLKGIIAIVAMYFAFRNIKWEELKAIRWSLSLVWLLPAILLYNGSQFISAYRLLQFYKLLEPTLVYRFNLQLYYIGMFYNLFLPGGVGGDFYKVMVIKKRGAALLQATKATLLDRATGLLVLLSIITVLANFVEINLPHKILRIVAIAVIPGFFCYWLIIRRYFKPFGAVIPKAISLSLLIQFCQLLSFCCLLLFFQAPWESIPRYAVVFFAGSVIAALPVSIGGIGTRELAMATGAAYLSLSPAIAVSASLFFYIITALSALTGWLCSKHSLVRIMEEKNN
ncbi:lysylphosphatidylglycerol synthase transmembrane domain-containing protein [Terrimonas pollutisoli]|uniref:lysylphosphatidylglycerol synthase transmembrane domain-containing protein n=1 Tax=Terrimonas pollutisoli TaxID=3034147 RepID=UPI0023ED26C4|nr:lysylphosphatidylglycerol synthase transmembrane domain-containing protein [Terrimonas sp. H1YJ31]